MERDEAIRMYSERKYSLRSTFYHFALGLQQIINNPLYILGIVILLAFCIALWNCRNFVQIETNTKIGLMLETVISYGLLLLVVLLVLLYVEFIGECIGRKYEGKLIYAFLTKDLRGGTPILIYRKWNKLRKVWVLSFYSLIPKVIWEERKVYIEDVLNVRIVNFGIDYGGKNKNNGNKVVLYVAKGRKPKKRGILYDEEL